MAAAEAERRESVSGWARVERERRAMVAEEARSVAGEREWQVQFVCIIMSRWRML
jgi:hypothetical protein